MTIILSYVEGEIWQKTLMLVAAILKSKMALIPLCYYHHHWPPWPRKRGFRHQNYPFILSRSWDMAYSFILMAAILKSNMAAEKRKSQPGKLGLPIMILEVLRNILIPLASFYPGCLADLILGTNLDSAPWLYNPINVMLRYCYVLLTDNTSLNLHTFCLSDMTNFLFDLADQTRFALRLGILPMKSWNIAYVCIVI